MDYLGLMRLYIRRRKSQGISERTLYDNSAHINRFLDYMGDDTDLEISVLSYFSDGAYTKDGKFISGTYWNQRIKTLSPFFDFLVERGEIKSNPIKDNKIKRRQDGRRAKDIPQDILLKMLKLCDKKTYQGVRDYAMLCLASDTGIRPSELINTEIKYLDINYTSLVIPAHVSKTRAPRTVCYSTPVATALEDYLYVRNKFRFKNDILFLSENGSPMKLHSWADRVEKYSDKCGFHLSPYDLRHLFAISYLRNGGNLVSLQKEMGHSDIKMTEHYLNITQDDIKKDHAIASPIANIIKRTKRVRKIEL